MFLNYVTYNFFLNCIIIYSLMRPWNVMIFPPESGPEMNIYGLYRMFFSSFFGKLLFTLLYIPVQNLSCRKRSLLVCVENQIFVNPTMWVQPLYITLQHISYPVSRGWKLFYPAFQRPRKRLYAFRKRNREKVYKSIYTGCNTKIWYFYIW